MTALPPGDRPEVLHSGADAQSGRRIKQAAELNDSDLSTGLLGAYWRRIGEDVAAFFAILFAILFKRRNPVTQKQMATQTARIDQIDATTKSLKNELFYMWFILNVVSVRQSPPTKEATVVCEHDDEIEALRERVIALEESQAVETVTVYREREVIPFSWWSALAGLLLGGLATYLLLPYWAASKVTLEMGREAQAVAMSSILEMQPIIIGVCILVGLIIGVCSGYLVGIPLYRRRIDREAA